MHRLMVFDREYSFLFILCIITMAGLIVSLTGCSDQGSTQEPQHIDKSFTTGQPCIAPCWYGLEINKSTEDEVLVKLQELPFVNPDSIHRWPGAIFHFQNGIDIDYECVGQPKKHCGSLYLSDGAVKVISYNVNYDLPLQFVISQLGTPDRVTFGLIAPRGCLVSLDWMSKLISIQILEQPKTEMCKELTSGKGFQSDARVNTIFYMDSEAFQAIVCRTPDCISWPGFREP